MTFSTLPLLIVGAGPTGLTLAIECCRHQIPFRLIERLEVPAPYSKALVIWQGSLRVFAAQGSLSDFKQQGLSVQEAKVCYLNQELIHIDPTEGAEVSKERPLLLSQHDTEKILSARLEALGGQIERGLEFISFSEATKENVLCQLKHADGRMEPFAASYLLACDGAKSVVRKQLEEAQRLRFEGYTEESQFRLGDFEFEGTYSMDHVQLSLSPEGLLGLIPVDGHVLRLISQKTFLNEAPSLAYFQNLLQRHEIPLRLQRALWLSDFRINERLSSHLVVDRILLLGDAAHIHSPAGGQGMNMGIQDAFNLGWKLAAALRSPSQASHLLQSYHEERYPILKKVVQKAALRTHFAIGQRPFLIPFKMALLKILSRFSMLRKRLVRDLSELYIRYPLSRFIMDPWAADFSRHCPRPGEGMRDIDLQDEKNRRCSLLEKCAAPAHTLLIFLAEGMPAQRNLLSALPSQCQLLFISPKLLSLSYPQLIDANLQAHRLYGARHASWYLIRPDHYIARRGPLNDVSSVLDYFQTLGT